MADDPRAILAEMTERERLTAMGHVRDPQDVPRLLAAVEAVLKLHHPVQLYGRVEDYRGNIVCGHPDYDGDLHFEGDDGVWYCRERLTVKVCASCCDEGDPDLRAEWECPTYRALLAALTGKGGTDG